MAPHDHRPDRGSGRRRSPARSRPLDGHYELAQTPIVGTRSNCAPARLIRRRSHVSITRREMLKTTGLVLGGLAVLGVLESCLTSTSSTPSGSIKIGFVSPITG